MEEFNPYEWDSEDEFLEAQEKMVRAQHYQEDVMAQNADRRDNWTVYSEWRRDKRGQSYLVTWYRGFSDIALDHTPSGRKTSKSWVQLTITYYNPKTDSYTVRVNVQRTVKLDSGRVIAPVTQHVFYARRNTKIQKAEIWVESGTFGALTTSGDTVDTDMFTWFTKKRGKIMRFYGGGMWHNYGPKDYLIVGSQIALEHAIPTYWEF